MNRIEEIFIQAVSCAIQSKPFPKEVSLTGTEWDSLYRLAFEQDLLPLVYDQLYSYSSRSKDNKEDLKKWKNISIETLTRQVIQTNEFLTLVLHAQKKGLNPVVVKGIVCRSLYPKPMLRHSVDEDVLIKPEQVKAFDQFFIEEGLFRDQPEEDLESAYEVSYHKENSPTYIELHKNLFDPDSDIYSSFNQYFDPDKNIDLQIEDVCLKTLEPSDHFIFLVLHDFKHFMFSGSGIRPLCDIGLFAEHYKDQLDWDYIQTKLSELNAYEYTRAILNIIRSYLLPEAEFFKDIIPWNVWEVNTDPLMNDILKAGLHGESSLTRLHSSNFTLTAVSNDRSQKNKSPLLSSAFLPYSSMKEKYPYLKKLPILLPAAWIQRFAHYISETLRTQKENGGTLASIRLGRQRIKLMKYYKIIK